MIRMNKLFVRLLPQNINKYNLEWFVNMMGLYMGRLIFGMLWALVIWWAYAQRERGGGDMIFGGLQYEFQQKFI